jgi:hypothetical protein
MKRQVMLFATVAGMLFASAGAAAAATDSGWTCDGKVCLRVVSDATMSPQDAYGCNGSVCISVTGTAARGYSSSGIGSGFYGHIHVWGPGGLNVNGPTAWSPVASGSGRGSGKTCAQGWENVTGGYLSVGRPCETVS